VALAVPLFPADEVKSLVVLTNTPPVADCTFTDTLQVDEGPTEPPETVIVDDPATAVMVPPKQLEIKPGAGDTTKPAGITSMNLMLVAALGDNELSMINRNTLPSPISTESGVKTFEKVGTVGAMVNISVAGAATTRWPDVKLLVVFKYGPGIAFTGIIRSTANVQLAPAARLPPLKLKPDELLSTEPTPHTSLLGRLELMTRPESTWSKLSVKDKSSRVSLVLRLVIVKLNELTPPASGAVAAKLFVNVAAFTCRVSLAVPLLPKDDVRSPVVFTYVAAIVEVVSTERVQLEDAAALPPV
jgi:hypothetical protein